jgi:predicted lipid-binding transport protein (Tim44 family)
VRQSSGIEIALSDYDVFERLLNGIQTTYSAEDLSALRAMITPEMLSYFSEELAANITADDSRNPRKRSYRSP